MKRTTFFRLSRWTILAAILLLTAVLGRLHQIIKIYPAVDAFCPFGGLESAWALIRYQGLLKRVAWSSVILLGTTIVTALVFRRSFCGNICPLGFLQELFGLGGRKLFKKKFELPSKADRILRYLKYLVLIVFLGLAWKTLTLAIRPYDPWVAFHHLGSDELLSEYLIGTLILGLSLLGGLFIDRPFCRYLCPMGGFLALPSKIGFIRIRRNAESCIDCGDCDRACPMAVSVSTVEEVKSSECINCAECVNTCPVSDTLSYSSPEIKGKTRNITSGIVIFGTLAVFLVVLGITTWTKNFVWKAETGLEKRVERLLWGPQKIQKDNTLVDIIQIFQIHPAYFAQELGLEREDQFYITLEELDIAPSKIEKMVNSLYEEAGLDPKNMFGGGGGGCSGGH